MRVAKVAVKNLRSIRDASLDLDPVTPILGPNGSGKSTWLLALKWFYEGVPQDLDPSDFFGGDWYGKEIEIAVTFTDLHSSVLEVDPRLEPYVRDGELTVVLRVPGPASAEESRPRPARYFGTVTQHEPFAIIRRLGGNAERTKAARALQAGESEMYSSIPLSGRGWADNDRALRAWEEEHPDLCILTDDDGQFFGPVAKPECPLNPITELITVPAVHDPAIEAEAAGPNLLNQLVQLSVRNPADSEEAALIQKDAESRFQDLITTHEETDLKELGNFVSGVLERYVPGTRARFAYRGGEASVRSPVAYVSLRERGFDGPLDRKGSGLQRLFIVSLIEAAADARSAPSGVPAPFERHQLLCVEEPELYQHPLQARRFARILWDFAGAESSHQVLYSTHSPEFLPPGRLEAYRLSVSEPDTLADGEVASRIRSTQMDKIVHMLQECGTPEAWLSPGRLDTFYEVQMNPEIREGFFAQGIVLVEGPEEVAVIDAHSRAINDPLGSHGIAVLPVGGKANLTRIAAALSAFALPTYLVFDSDCNANEEERRRNASLNHSIQGFVGLNDPQEFPATSALARFCVFSPNLTQVLPSLFPGGSFEEEKSATAEKLGWPRPNDTRKNPNALRAILDRLYERSGPPQLLRDLHEAIRAHMTPPGR